MKAAYDALSYETARQHSEQSHPSNSQSAEQLSQQAAESAALLLRANELNSSLEEQLEEAQRSVRELQKLPGMLNAAEEKLRATVADKAKVQKVFGFSSFYRCVSQRYVKVSTCTYLLTYFIIS